MVHILKEHTKNFLSDIFEALSMPDFHVIFLHAWLTKNVKKITQNTSLAFEKD